MSDRWSPLAVLIWSAVTVIPSVFLACYSIYLAANGELLAVLGPCVVLAWVAATIGLWTKVIDP